MPNFEFDVEGSDLTEEEAFKLVYASVEGRWRKTDHCLEGNIIRYSNYMLRNTGLFCICGARGCIRACMDNLEKAKKNQ